MVCWRPLVSSDCLVLIEFSLEEYVREITRRSETEELKSRFEERERKQNRWHVHLLYASPEKG